MAPFHLSLTVHDLAAARSFYGDVLGCTEAASAATWIDFDFFGHQLSLHLGAPAVSVATGQVDGHAVPMPHFGVVLEMDAWRRLGDRLEALGVAFVMPPTVRYDGHPREQGTFFVRDASGNALEFKAMRDPALLFEPLGH